MKNIRFLLLLLFTSLLLFNLHAEAYNCKSFTVNTVSKDQTNIKFKLPVYKISTIEAFSTTYNRIEAEESDFTTLEGVAELPFYTLSIAVPLNSEISLHAQSITKSEVVNNIKIYPVQLSDQNADFKIDQDYYNRDQQYPENTVFISDIQTIRDYNIININVYPFSYNAKNKILNVYSEMEISVNHLSSGQGYQNFPEISRAFEPFYRSFIANYEQIRSDYPVYQQPSLLIIHPNNSDTNFTSALNSVINWKKQKGFTVNTANATQTGNSTSSIKAYIQNAYNTWEARPEYIMLVGDVSGTGYGIPTYSEAYGFLASVPGAGDYPYTLLSNDDYLGDVIIGRVSVSSITHLQTMASKILLYEKNPTIAGTDWFNENLLVGDTSPSGVSCIVTNKYIKELLEEYDSSHNYLELYGSQPSATSMQNKLSSGVLFFNYRGYIGMSGFTSTNVTNATNIKKLTNAIFITCATGAFSGSSIIEDITRVGTPAEPKGPITAIGMSTSHTLTPYNNVLNSGIFHALFRENITSMSAAMLYAKLYIHRVHASSNIAAARTFCQWLNIMGDPTVNAYRSVPKQMTVTKPSSINIGANYFPVTLKNSAGQAIKDAWISLTDANFNKIAFAVTDESGHANLSLSTYTEGTLTLVVTHPDYRASISTIQAGTEALVSINAYTLLDSPNGNNNNQINPGETIIVSTNIKNNLSLNQNNLNLVLRSSNPYIMITDSTAQISNIGAGSIVNLTDEFQFSVNPDYPNNCPLNLFLHVYSASQEWISLINESVKAADLDVMAMTVNATNQVIPLNTPTQISFTIRNNGSINATGINAVLRSMDNNLIIADSTANYGTINAGSELTNSSDTFTIQTSLAVYPGETLKAQLIFSNAESFIESENVLIKVGNLSSSDPLAPDAYGYIILDDSDVLYENAPSYNWIDIVSVGTALNLPDTGNNSDVVIAVDLPFIFKMYGQSFTQMSVCSNGWLSMGVTEQANFRNMPLPGPFAPENIIAPFWNDLFKSGTNSGVYTYYNATEHFYVVQWNSMKNYSNNQINTFEVILYDPLYYANGFGDSPIKFQYQTFNAGAQNDSNDPETPSNFFTTGIQNQDASVGLTYAYNNLYAPGAASLGNGKALLITSKSTIISSHFVPVWLEEPIDPITFTVNSAYVNSSPLNAGDEIAIFDNQYCVGSVKLDSNINPSITIITSADNSSTVSTDGYQSGHNISYKIWKISTQTEYSGACMQTHYLNGSNIFNPDSTYTIAINAAIATTQAIPLTQGWNKISTKLLPNNPDLLSVFSELISAEKLIKVQSETGFSLEALPAIGWINNIGNYSSTEGYWVKVNSDCNLTINAFPVFLPLEIPLNSGWNIISYPYSNSMNAMSLFQNLINAGLLIKVTDQSGNSIEQLTNPSSWVNNIGSLSEGMAYSVCVSRDTVLTYDFVINTNNPNPYLSNNNNNRNPESHFIPIWSGNGYQHMNFHILNPLLNDNSLNSGDEIAVFDADRCVASAVIADNNEYVFMNASMNDSLDSNVNGFIPGHSYSLKLFINATQQEISDPSFQFINGSTTLESGASAILTINATVSGNEFLLPKTTQLNANYPNPFNPETTISFSLKEDSPVTIEIYNIKGQLVKQLFNNKLNAGNHKLLWNGKDNTNKNVSSGVYFYKMKSKTYSACKKMLLMK